MRDDLEKHLAEMRVNNKAQEWPLALWGRFDGWMMHVLAIFVGAAAIFLTAYKLGVTNGH